MVIIAQIILLVKTFSRQNLPLLEDALTHWLLRFAEPRPVMQKAGLLWWFGGGRGRTSDLERELSQGDGVRKFGAGSKKKAGARRFLRRQAEFLRHDHHAAGQKVKSSPVAVSSLLEVAPVNTQVLAAAQIPYPA